MQFLVLILTVGLSNLFFTLGLASPVLSASQEAELAILKQLGELRREMHSLRIEMRELRQSVNKLQQSALPSSRTATPQPTTLEMPPDDSRTLGSHEAKIALVEFTDYQCPFCKRFHSEVFAKLKESYVDSGKVQYMSRDFPLPNHAQAISAAIASRCAGKEGAFWQMREELFANQDNLGTALYESLPTRLGINPKNFLECLENDEERSKVESELSFGRRVGIQGTPAFFVGLKEDGKLIQGRWIVGAQLYSAFSQMIDSLLKE